MEWKNVSMLIVFTVSAIMHEYVVREKEREIEREGVRDKEKGREKKRDRKRRKKRNEEKKPGGGK